MLVHTQYRNFRKATRRSLKKQQKLKRKEKSMKASKGSVIAVLALTAAVGGFAVAGFLKQPAKEPEQTTETRNEVQTEAETLPEATEALEYVTDENWDTMVHVYRIIMANSATAEKLVMSGQADPDDVMRRANEIIEFGKGCERDNLLNQEAEVALYNMVEVADDMLTLIKEGGGEIVEVPSAEETEQGSDAEGQEDGIGAEGADTVADTKAEGRETEAAG